MSAKDDEVAVIVTELDRLLDQLRDNVAALSTILAPPDEPAPGKEFAL